MPEFCWICTRFEIEKEQKKNMTLDGGRRWKHFNLRVRGLPLASDVAYDKNDANSCHILLTL